MKKTALTAALAMILGSSVAFAAPSQKDAANAIFEAVSANNKAAKIGFEWRDTYKKLLGPAKKAYKKGNYGKAVKLANTAKAHAKLGVVQAGKASGADLISN
ncbi:MAG: hypothetical protein GXP13_04510 [Gammaproteobacteria bacterium]|nr:hypothetical protein [Gammaproteobacteria bacterium]